MQFVAQDLPQSVIGATRPTLLDILAYVPVRLFYGESLRNCCSDSG